MKRFLAFAFDAFYPAGGQGDFVGDFDTIEAAAVQPTRRNYMDVLDTSNGEWCSFTLNGAKWTRDA